MYRVLEEQVASLIDGEKDLVANLANVSALLRMELCVPELSWVGFYLVTANHSEMVLGPFQGKPACIRIPKGKGVCGTAMEEGTTQHIDNVHAFPGHIACDPTAKSELVVPITVADTVVAVLDLDSTAPAAFSKQDRVGLESIAALLARTQHWPHWPQRLLQ